MKALRAALLASMLTLLARVALAQSSKETDRSVPAPSAPARDRAAFRHRAFVGPGIGYLFTSTKVNGKSVDVESELDGSGGNTYGLELGLEERFTRLFSLAGRMRYFSVNNDWAVSVGYERTLLDLGLEPRLWLKPKMSGAAAWRFEFYTGIGSGVTLASEKPPPRRAYDERIDGSPGYYLSTCFGATLSGAHVAMFTELGYAFHSTHVVATLEPRAPGVARTVEERDYLNHLVLFSIGIVAGFGALE